MAPLPPPSCSESWSPAASASSASECGSENVGRWPLEVRFNGGVIQARGLPPLPSALHGLLRGHGRALARRLAELQHGAEEAICKVQAAVDSAVCKAVTSWFQLPANAVRQQAKRGKVASGKSCSLRAHNFAAIIPGDSVAEVVVTSSIFNFLNIYNTLLITRLVLTWFPNPPEAIANPLSTICDPYLNLFRGIIPPLGGTLDLSPILAFLVLNVFTNTASALPAELPRDDNIAGPGATAFTDNAAEGATWRQRAQSKKAGILRKQVIAADKEKSR